MKRIREIPRIPRRKRDTNKGDYGKVLIIAGSPGFTGAAYLTGKGALISGSGLVTVGCPESLMPILASKFTCVMTLPLPETDSHFLSEAALAAILAKCETCDAVAVGPGIGTQAQTKTLVQTLVREVRIPLVMDADGLNNLAGSAQILLERKAPVVVTPHPGEMSRLIGISIDQIQKNREGVAVQFSRKYNVVTVLKGYKTVVTDGERVYLNRTGNPGMATGGTGDVLTGMVASFIGQGFGVFESAQLAVYLHGLAGDMAAKKYGEVSLIATNLLESLPQAIQKHQRSEAR
jgi:NAD(P)H-hydrate epimerase